MPPRDRRTPRGAHTAPSPVDAPPDQRPRTTHEVAELLGVTIPTVVNWIERGYLAGHRTPGGHRRVAPAELERFARRIGADVALEGEPRSPRVLIIGDDREELDLLQRRLSEDGCEVQRAAGGFEAGWRLGRLQPDVVVVDVASPGPTADEVRATVACGDDAAAMSVLTRRPQDAPDTVRRQVHRALGSTFFG